MKEHLDRVTLLPPDGLPEVGYIREDGKMCKVAQHGYVTVGKRKQEFTVTCWGNPNPDPVEKQRQINALNDYILECAERHRAEKLLAEREEKERAMAE